MIYQIESISYHLVTLKYYCFLPTYFTPGIWNKFLNIVLYLHVYNTLCLEFTCVIWVNKTLQYYKNTRQIDANIHPVIKHNYSVKTLLHS